MKSILNATNLGTVDYEQRLRLARLTLGVAVAGFATCLIGMG